MPSFQYQARSSQGDLMNGSVEAESAALAAQMLVERGWVPVTVKPGRRENDILQQLQRWYATKKLTIGDLMIFTR